MGILGWLFGTPQAGGGTETWFKPDGSVGGTIQNYGNGHGWISSTDGESHQVELSVDHDDSMVDDVSSDCDDYFDDCY